MGGQADDAVFRPVRTGNPFEEAVERLLQAIKLGVVVPGDRLPSERDLAARLNVSRVTLREAIHALAEAGYVESRRGRYGGTFVNEHLPKPRRTPAKRLARELGDGLEDALVLRSALETGAAEAAAARALSEAEREHLCRCLAETSAATLTDYRRLDSRLHLADCGGDRLSVADVRDRRRPHASERALGRDPFAGKEHPALERPASGDRRRHPRRRSRSGTARDARAPFRNCRPAESLPRLIPLPSDFPGAAVCCFPPAGSGDLRQDDGA